MLNHSFFVVQSIVEVAKLTKLMLERIAPVMENRLTLDEFRVWAREKARSLLDENLGPDLLNSVGYVYR